MARRRERGGGRGKSFRLEALEAGLLRGKQEEGWGSRRR